MRKETLRDSHIHEGQIYGPGTDVDVPDNFPTRENLRGLDAPAPSEPGTGPVAATRSTAVAGADTGDRTVTHPDYGVAGDPKSLTPHAGAPRPVPTQPNGTDAEAARANAATVTPGGTGMSAEAFSEFTVDELRDMAADRGLTVERLDDKGKPEDGNPIKRDYIRALSAAPAPAPAGEGTGGTE